jgi:hypothetical protein
LHITQKYSTSEPRPRQVQFVVPKGAEAAGLIEQLSKLIRDPSSVNEPGPSRATSKSMQAKTSSGDAGHNDLEKDENASSMHSSLFFHHCEPGARAERHSRRARSGQAVGEARR